MFSQLLVGKELTSHWVYQHEITLASVILYPYLSIEPLCAVPERSSFHLD